MDTKNHVALTVIWNPCMYLHGIGKVVSEVLVAP
jgi:hypothetical protein